MWSNFLGRNLVMKKRLTAIVAGVMALASCGSPDTDRTIGLAEEAVESGDYVRAREFCDDLALGPDSATMSVSQLGRMSIIYVQLADNADEDENMAMAVRCFNMARRLSADSIEIFYHGLGAEHMRHAMTLMSLMRGLSVNPDSLVDEPMNDTIPVD